MSQTALPAEILLKAEKPARYTGGELHAAVKDPDQIRVRFVMCFPDVYEIGMSYTGIQIIYHLLNRRPDVWCERVYSPWPDMDRLMREHRIPLFSLESQRPVKEADFLGITLQYEMCYTNILQILDLSGIPLQSEERGEEDPVVIGGGPCTYNPEPVAAFFDLFYIGEAETRMGELIDLYEEIKDSGGSRKDFLRRAASLEGIYVPSLYEVSYREDGTIASFLPTEEGVPETVVRQAVSRFLPEDWPDEPVVPNMQVTQDRAVLEIMRGCIRGCRFCQAGMIYRPLREKEPEQLLEQARHMLESTGYEEISLSSLSSSDYSRLPELMKGLLDCCEKNHVNIALPSLRIDAFSLDVMEKVQDVRKSSLTFAPEGGTQRIRDVINKGLTEEDILNGAEQAFLAGWKKVKLYFMLGLPTETAEDRKGIAELSDRIVRKYYDVLPKEGRGGRVSVNASASFFVPKPFTPFQWAVMEEPEEYLRRAGEVKDAFQAQLNRRSLSFSYHDAWTSVLEGLLARGDRRVSAVILEAYRSGCTFDAWSDYMEAERWKKALEKTGTDLAFYTSRPRSADEVFPWDFLDIGISKSFLRREWERAMEGKITPNCREQCSGCGASRVKGGCCP